MIHLRRLIFWMTVTFLVGFLAHATASERPESGPLAVMACCLLVACNVTLRGRMSLGIPRWIFNALLLAATLNLFREGLVIIRMREPDQAVATLANYLLALQLIKLFEGRRPRDLAQTIALNVMLVVAAVLESVTFALALSLLLYIPCVLMTVYAYHLYAGAHAAAAVSLGRAPEPEEILPAEPRSPGLTATLAALAGVSIVGAALVAAVVFFIMPRGIGEEAIGRMPQASTGATTDFSDQVQLGGDSIVSESRDIVLTMRRLHQGSVASANVTQYLRGVTLDVYDRQSFSWKRSDTLDAADRGDANRIHSRRQPNDLPDVRRRRPGAVEQQVELRSKSSNFLFALYYPTEVVTGSRPPIFRNAIDGSLRMISSQRYVEYQLLSDLDRGFPLEEEIDRISRLRESDEGAPTYAYFAEGPIADEARRVIEAAGLRRDPADIVTPADDAILARIEGHFRGGFTYTLDAAPPLDRDPIEWFLTEGRAGHCEYFASAMAAMCRSLGIHARVVTGFATSEFDATGRHYVARRNHAHAWIEAPVLVTTAGEDGAERTRIVWKTFDPTPPSDRAAFTAQPGGPIALARRLYEQAESFWITSVMAFDDGNQLSLFESSARIVGVEDALDRLHNRPDRAIARVLTAATLFVGTFAVVAALLFAARAVWRALAARFPALAAALAPRRRGARRYTPEAFFVRADRLLRRAGVPRPAHRPPLEHARAIAAVDPPLASAAERIAHLHYLRRYRDVPLTDEQRRSAADALSAMADAARRLKRGRAS